MRAARRAADAEAVMELLGTVDAATGTTIATTLGFGYGRAFRALRLLEGDGRVVKRWVDDGSGVGLRAVYRRRT